MQWRCGPQPPTLGLHTVQRCQLEGSVKSFQPSHSEDVFTTCSEVLSIRHPFSELAKMGINGQFEQLIKTRVVETAHG